MSISSKHAHTSTISPSLFPLRVFPWNHGAPALAALMDIWRRNLAGGGSYPSYAAIGSGVFGDIQSEEARKNKAKRAIKVLVDLELVMKKPRRRGDGSQTSNEYAITDFAHTGVRPSSESSEKERVETGSGEKTEIGAMGGSSQYRGGGLSQSRGAGLSQSRGPRADVDSQIAANPRPVSSSAENTGTEGGLSQCPHEKIKRKKEKKSAREPNFYSLSNPQPDHRPKSSREPEAVSVRGDNTPPSTYEGTDEERQAALAAAKAEFAQRLRESAKAAPQQALAQREKYRSRSAHLPPSRSAGPTRVPRPRAKHAFTTVQDAICEAGWRNEDRDRPGTSCAPHRASSSLRADSPGS